MSLWSLLDNDTRSLIYRYDPTFKLRYDEVVRSVPSFLQVPCCGGGEKHVFKKVFYSTVVHWIDGLSDVETSANCCLSCVVATVLNDLDGLALRGFIYEGDCIRDIVCSINSVVNHLNCAGIDPDFQNIVTIRLVSLSSSPAFLLALPVSRHHSVVDWAVSLTSVRYRY